MLSDADVPEPEVSDAWVSGRDYNILERVNRPRDGQKGQGAESVVSASPLPSTFCDAARSQFKPPPCAKRPRRFSASIIPARSSP